MPDLSETDPELIKKLQALMDNYGPEGVRSTVQQMIGQMLMSAAGLADIPAQVPVTDADFFVSFEDAETLDQVVGQAVGAGSVCWENMAGTGTFQDRRALTIVQQAVHRIRALVESARAEEIAELRRQRDKAEDIAQARGEHLDALEDGTATLVQDLTRVLNRHSVENGSNTPDFLLAEYLVRNLQSAQMLINRRTGWWGLPDTFEKLTGQDKPLDP